MFLIVKDFGLITDQKALTVEYFTEKGYIHGQMLHASTDVISQIIQYLIIIAS